MNMGQDDIKALTEFCRATLDLANAQLSEEYGYSSLPLCVIDAVFSIGVNYTSTRNTVSRFCDYVGLRQTSRVHPPDVTDQWSISELIKLYERYGAERMAKELYRNLQRTSSRNGILKSEAVLRFSKTLSRFGVDYYQDINTILGDKKFEAAIMEIPGQRSGLSVRYFYMLAGSDDYVKPDRMIIRFIQSATGKSPSMDESHSLIVGACSSLANEYPNLTPRALDHLIWQFQRTS